MKANKVLKALKQTIEELSFPLLIIGSFAFLSSIPFLVPFFVKILQPYTAQIIWSVEHFPLILVGMTAVLIALLTLIHLSSAEGE